MILTLTATRQGLSPKQQEMLPGLFAALPAVLVHGGAVGGDEQVDAFLAPGRVDGGAGMTPADRLIVALDGDAAEMGAVFARLHRETPLRFFKFGPQMLLQHSGMTLIENMMREGNVDLFLDLKVYDTRDTVENVVRRAFDLGARFVTVHATPSVMKAAMRAKPADRGRTAVIAVPWMTDQSTVNLDPRWVKRTEECLDICSGIIAPSWLLAEPFAAKWKDKLRICPGIRSKEEKLNNHVQRITPFQALRAGADYLVVGRPIWQSPDPVGTARAIIAEMETA